MLSLLMEFTLEEFWAIQNAPDLLDDTSCVNKLFKMFSDNHLVLPNGYRWTNW